MATTRRAPKRACMAGSTTARKTRKSTSQYTKRAGAPSAHHDNWGGSTINEHGNLDPMPKTGRSKSQSRSHAKDATAHFCEQNDFTYDQYAKMYHHFRCDGAPAYENRGRGSSRARTDGGRSGHTSRGASPSGGKPRDQLMDAVKRRYKSACDYVKGDEIMSAQFSRNDILAKAYELERTNNHALVVDHLQDHGLAKAPYPTEALAKFGERPDPLPSGCGGLSQAMYSPPGLISVGWPRRLVLP